jgi:hypothetical protein
MFTAITVMGAKLKQGGEVASAGHVPDAFERGGCCGKLDLASHTLLAL